MNKQSSRLCLVLSILAFWLVPNAAAQTLARRENPQPAGLATQNSVVSTPTTPVKQSVVNSLSSLPEADTLIYISPQRILNDAVPRVMASADVAKMRSSFDDIKKSVGVDPSRIDYLVIAVRFRKPAADLSFMAPDFLIVAGGDFSAESLSTVARLTLQSAQQKFHDEKYGSKTLTLVTIDPIAKEAEKNPLLKSFSELGFVSLNANTVAIGNTAYLKAAIDAGEGKGRIATEVISSLLRDPNALLSASGSPLVSFAKSFGLLGTETTPRDPRCESKFGDFYSALTMDATNFSLRGAMNADNPDTAKIINGLLAGFLEQAVSSVPDKDAQTLLKGLKMMAKESEVVWEADIPQQTAADLIRQQMKPKAATVSTTEDKSPQAPSKRPTRRRHRTRRP